MMHNIWLVARHEFMTNIRKKSFLFAVFGMPIFIGVIYVVVFVAAMLAEDQGISVNTLGYVDQADILVEDIGAPDGWVSFPDQEVARTALEAAEIDAYFVLPEDYLNSGEVSIMAYGKTPDTLQDDIGAFIVANLTAALDTNAPPERLYDPVNVRFFLENSQRELSEEGLVGLLIVPMIFAVVLMIALQLSATFLMSGVAEEKANHIMEILISSITAGELLTGKLLGLGVLGLIQVLVWMILGAVLLLVGGDSTWLSAVNFPPDVIGLALIYFILTYFMYAGVLAGIGAVVGSEQESRQYASLVMFPIAIPFMFFALFLTNPNSPILVFLTLLPITSAMTVMLRLPFGVVPFWQIALSIVLQALTSLFFLWVSAKIFRWALLLYGKKVGVRALWQVIRGTPDTGILPSHSREQMG